MLFFLISPYLRSHWLNRTAWLLIFIQLPFSGLFPADILLIWFMKNASTSFKNSKRKGPSKAKNYSYSFDTQSSLQLFLIVDNFFLLFFLFLEVSFRQQLFLTLENRFHGTEILLKNLWLRLLVKMRVNALIHEVISESTFVIVEGRVNQRPIDVY